MSNSNLYSVTLIVSPNGDTKYTIDIDYLINAYTFGEAVDKALTEQMERPGEVVGIRCCYSDTVYLP